MTLPIPLEHDRDFMKLLRMATFGASDAKRADIETLVALAFIKGESAGIERSIDIMRAKA